ncbi:MAG: hypothetical protein V3V86_11460 [Gammaproteobacteria bacterium]
MDREKDSPGSDAGLSRSLGLTLITLYGLGNILGAGITLVALERRQPRATGVMPCPMWVPMAGATASFGLLVAQILR